MGDRASPPPGEPLRLLLGTILPWPVSCVVFLVGTVVIVVLGDPAPEGSTDDPGFGALSLFVFAFPFIALASLLFSVTMEFWVLRRFSSWIGVIAWGCVLGTAAELLSFHGLPFRWLGAGTGAVTAVILRGLYRSAQRRESARREERLAGDPARR